MGSFCNPRVCTCLYVKTVEIKSLGDVKTSLMPLGVKSLLPLYQQTCNKQDNVRANSESVQCSLYLSSFSKYLACNFDDLELGLLKVIPSQRS